MGSAAGLQVHRSAVAGVPGTSAQKNASCLWATRDTVGALFPATPGYDAAV